ncbi:MAG TPA: nucleotidyltransferase domain-containing protein [Chloroflexia bacterium]|nr:nucleotidyltransferase domain-containing protein [Chloroflexia bacterium]
MREHHRRVIDKLVAEFENDPNYLALIVGGSVAKGRAKEDSDVDVLLVATDEEYARKAANSAYWYFNREICDYPGGYAEGKIVNLKFLEDAADHGSERARAAFSHFIIGFSRLPGLEDLLNRIPVYPENEREEKMARFYSQVQLLGWFVGEAEKRQDPYLLAHSSSDLVFYGGRLILAYNRILYPYHKWFMYELERAELKPDNFMELAGRLLKEPGSETATAFRDSLFSYRDWGVRYDQAIVHFMEDTEWTWRHGRPPLADW